MRTSPAHHATPTVDLRSLHNGQLPGKWSPATRNHPSILESVGTEQGPTLEIPTKGLLDSRRILGGGHGI
jgi:hypothetical protein